MAPETPPFEQLVFSGGGTRCFWHGGFCDVIRDVLPLEPKRIAAVSGGALSAAAFIAHRGHKTLETMAEAFSDNDANIAWHSFDEDGLTPHQRIYREVLEEVFDKDALGAVADGPSFQILIGHPPSERHPKLSGTLATLAYEAELHLKGDPHFDWAEATGVDAVLVDARQAARDGRLTDLVAAAATIPPIFEPPRWDGRPVIDGGMADQAPMPDPDTGRTLVLLTRHYKGLSATKGRVYVEPEADCPADKIDFTDPDKIRQTWDCGMTDGRTYLETLTQKTED